MAHEVCEFLWIIIIIIFDDLKVGWEGPIRLYDNKSAISNAQNPVQHYQSKHVEIDHHLIKEKLYSGVVCTSYTSIKRQLVDLLTKGLTTLPFHSIAAKRGMKNISA